MNDTEIEAEIRARGLTAPRITPADIEANIAGENYFTLAQATAGAPQFPGFATFTMCALTLKNGFIVIGYSAPASPENFDEAIGQKIAKQKAVDQIWPLMGYALRNKLMADAVMHANVERNVSAETHEFMGTRPGEPEPDLGVMRSDPSHDNGELPK